MRTTRLVKRLGLIAEMPSEIRPLANRASGLASEVVTVEHDNAAHKDEPTENEVHPVTEEVTPVRIRLESALALRLQEVGRALHLEAGGTFSVATGTTATTDVFPLPLGRMEKLRDAGVDVMNMEDFAVAQVGWLFDVPVAAIRGVSDLPLSDKRFRGLIQANVDRVESYIVQLLVRFFEEESASVWRRKGRLGARPEW